MFKRIPFSRIEKPPAPPETTKQEKSFTNLPPEEAVEDIDKAEEMAYTEKPFQDALREYEDNLKPDQKKALETIASLKAHEAGAAYEKKKGEEDPRITAIRENLKNLFELGVTVKEGEDLRNFAHPKIEAILDQDMPPHEKYEKIKALAAALIEGARSKYENMVDRSADKIVDMNRFLNESSEEDIKQKYGSLENVRNMASGIIIKNMGDHCEKCMELIDSLAKATHESIPDVLKEYLSFIKVARKHRDSKYVYDSSMEKRGYLWDEKKQEYVEL